jgi:hypothetical protein
MFTHMSRTRIQQTARHPRTHYLILSECRSWRAHRPELATRFYTPVLLQSRTIKFGQWTIKIGQSHTYTLFGQSTSSNGQSSSSKRMHTLFNYLNSNNLKIILDILLLGLEIKYSYIKSA